MDEQVSSELSRLSDPVAVLEAMFANAPVALQLYEVSGRSVLTNAAFRERYGGEPPPGYNVFRDEVAERAGMTALIRRAFAGEQVTTPPHWYDPRGLEHVSVPDGQRVGQIITMTPLRDRDGAVSHVAIFVKDVTAELAERERSAAELGRLKVVADVSAAVTAVLDAHDASARIAALLVPGICELCTLLVMEDGALTRVTEAAQDPSREGELRAMREEGTLPPPVAEAFLGPAVRMFPDYLAWVRDALPADDPYRQRVEAIAPGPLVTAPLRARDRVIGVLVLGMSRAGRRTFPPEDVALVGVLAERIGVALDNAALFAQARRAGEQLATENRVNQTLVRLAAAFANAHDVGALTQLATDEATALIGARFGAMFWNVQDDDGSYTLHVLSGADAKAFATFPMPRATPLFGPTFRGEAPIRLDDVTRDPRYGQVGPQPAGHPTVTSYLAVPVVARTGGVLGGLFFGHPEAGKFTADHEMLIVGIAAQAAAALEGVRLYDALRASEERARTAVRRKDEFLAILGHELRNPLAPIVTALELMRLRDGANAVERERTVIDRQVTHLSRLVDDLLDLSRITSGKITLQRGRLDATDVIADAVERVSPLLDAKQLHVEVQARRGADLVIDGDRDRLTQVMTNLVHNAAKFTPACGHITITATRTVGQIAIEVRDDGPGFDSELRAAIFELFVQGSQDLQRAGGGLGIGLALVKHLTEMHDGTVTADSAGPGTGAVFRVVLPAATVEAPSRAGEVRTREVEPSIVRKRILVVDDNVDAANILADVLARLGHEVRVAGDGVQALAVAGEHRPEVAILDIGLPVMDGYELAGRLRSLVAGPLRLIALTGYGQEDDLERARAAGFDAHLVKPASVRAVLGALDA